MNSLNSTPNSELTHPTVHWKLLPWCLVVNVVIVQLISHVRLFGISWTTACQAPLSSTVSWSLLKFMSIESAVLSNRLILCHLLLLLPLIFPSIKVFSNDLALRIRCQSIGTLAFSISPSSEYSGLISFRIDWFDLLCLITTSYFFVIFVASLKKIVLSAWLHPTVK